MDCLGCFVRGRLQRKGLATRQSQAYPASAGGPLPSCIPWFASSVFRVADMIGTDGHVSFLPKKKKKKKRKSPRRHHATGRGVASLEGWSSGQGSILGSVRCGGTGLPQALGLFVSLPFRRAIAHLVPSVCGTVPPREGGAPC